ncbi:MAG: hypothetical protein ACYTHJ_20865 [Planctomycetota bacterium]|jgi:hypothetical protein
MTIRTKTSVNKLYNTYAATSTGGINANGDYSGAAKAFQIAPSSTETLRLERVIVYIEDEGARFTESAYGAITNGLTVGIHVHHKTSTGGILLDLTGQLPIKTNGQWRRLCYDVTLTENQSGTNSNTVRWTWGKAGTPLRIEGASSETLDFILNDSCTGLTDQTFMVQGYYENVWT